MYVCEPVHGLVTFCGGGGGIKTRFAKNQTHKAPPDSLFTINWIRRWRPGYIPLSCFIFSRGISTAQWTLLSWLSRSMTSYGQEPRWRRLAWACRRRWRLHSSLATITRPPRETNSARSWSRSSSWTRRWTPETTINEAVREFVSSTTMQEFQQVMKVMKHQLRSYMCSCATIYTRADSNKRTLSRVISRVISRVVACSSWKNLGNRLWN